MYNGNGNNISISNRVEKIYDVILGAGCVVFSILALANLFIITINKFAHYYSRQIDRIVMDESESEFSDDDDNTVKTARVKPVRRVNAMTMMTLN
jgi:hypothetical protein